MTAFALAFLASTAVASQAAPSPSPTPAPYAIDTSVVFGRHGGLALLMDLHRPPRPNGRAVVYVPGSGFHTPAGYGARPITAFTRPWVPALVEAGYSVFVVNHRSAPVFRHPAALEDVRRAVRYVRHVAPQYGVAADRLGAAGYSSGATLASLLGVADVEPDPAASDVVERHSSRVQCVMGGGGAYDLLGARTTLAASVLGSYIGMTPELGYAKGGPEHRAFEQASPASHASPGDAPHLLIHGDADEILPVTQAETMAAALEKAGVPVTLFRIPGGTHGRLTPPGHPDFLGEMIRFFDHCLGRGAPGTSPR